MPKEFIVAIELGSSEITGIAGSKNLDDSISVLAVAKEDATPCIHNGVIYNITKTVQTLNSIIKKLEASLKTKIDKVYVAVGGQSIQSIRNVIVKDFTSETIITQEMVDELTDTNRTMKYPDKTTINAITQEYKVDSQNQIDPVGIQCTHIEGNFLNILERTTFYNNLNKCFDDANIAVVDMFLAPLALADSILTETEKRSGCLLVDLGASTTTIAVYFKNILRHLAVIPLGGKNITKDIESLNIEEDEAEKLKIEFGSAYTPAEEIDSTKLVTIAADRRIESGEFINIVEARVSEIILNVWHNVPNEYLDKLMGGIILTGGGSNMKNIDVAFREQTNVSKIRIANFVTQTINSTSEYITKRDGKMNTILGLLAKADTNCAGAEIKDDLFGESSNTTTTTDIHQEPRDRKTLDENGIVMTAAEIQRAEEEERRKVAEAAKAKEEAEREERRKNSPLFKVKKWISDAGEKLMGADDE